MHLHQSLWSPSQHLVLQEDTAFQASASQLVFVFALREWFDKHDYSKQLRDKFPNAHIVYSSSAGQISGSQIHEDALIATALQFEHSKVVCRIRNFQDFTNSAHCAEDLCKGLAHEELQAICVLSEGTVVNASELLAGIATAIDTSIPVFGGLAGDGLLFQQTTVGLNAAPTEGNVVLIAFYGKALHFGFASEGGWMPYGPERVVSKSYKNILYEIANRPALDIYKEYLGKYAEGLPAMSLIFPLSIRKNFDSPSVVRTILSINEADKSMTFAGNIPEGYLVRMMSAHADDLIDAAALAAKNCLPNQHTHRTLALLVSCVGRKMVLADRTEEELEISQEQFGEGVMLAGYYAYGEISPNLALQQSSLHNQTLTITTIWESPASAENS